jgi:hypothetical protein
VGNAAGAGGSIPDCEGEVTSDVFDPNRVYLIGTLSESSCGRTAIAAIECPNSAAVGFTCDFRGNTSYPHSAQIRPGDGRLLYSQVPGELREFYCDLCPFRDRNGDRYPENVADNDPILLRLGSPSVTEPEFLVSPSGRFFHRREDGSWLVDTGGIAYDVEGSTLVHIGFDSVALAGPYGARRNDRVDSLVHLFGGGSVQVIGLPDRDISSIRAAPPDRFVLTVRADNGLQGEWELWEIDASATATLRGQYPPFPNGLQDWSLQELTPNGVLFGMANDLGTFDDVIVRREIGGVSEIVYTEADNPIVKIHGSSFLSGP